MTYSNNNQALSLPTVRLFFGVCAILLSLVFSIQFVAQGAGGAAIISAVIFCLVTEFCKVTFTGDFGYYWETGQGSKSLFYGVLVVLLFALSISSAVYVLTIAPTKNDAIITQSDTRTETLQKQIAAKQAQVSACNPSYISKCIKPLNDQLTDLQGELNALLKQNDSLTEAKANAEFWNKTAKYFNTDANSLQLNWAILRATILDLLGLVLISNYSTTKRLNNDLTRYQQQIVQQQPNQQPPQKRQAQPLPSYDFKNLKW